MQQINLRNELLKENKPKHQANDSLSLSWILSNKPKFEINHNLQKEYLKYVLEFKPWKLFKNEFYADKQVLKNIHGKNHAIRVTINMFLLLLELNLTKKIVLNDIAYMGLFHDCSRINDNKDEKHGERSSVLFLEKLKKEKFMINDKYAISSAIKYHDIKYGEFENDNDYIKNKLFCDLIKTADSLDRYRFPRDDWWIDDKYLKIIPSENLKSLSFDICYNSEKESMGNNSIGFDKILFKLIDVY